jgi:hypothetical protein
VVAAKKYQLLAKRMQLFETQKLYLITISQILEHLLDAIINNNFSSYPDFYSRKQAFQHAQNIVSFFCCRK